MQIVQKYKFSYTLTFIKEHNRIYNWLNGEYVEFDNLEHPFLEIIKTKKQEFEKFKYQDTYEDFDWLVDNKFIVVSQDEIDQTVKNEVITREEKNELNLILLPANNACNFNCLYCYEDHSQKQFMKTNEKNLLLNFIKNQKIKKLTIEWFGGEPLLNVTFIKELCAELKNDKTLLFSSSMTTNGYLLDVELFKDLVTLGITNYQITIDGEEQDHNITRPLLNSTSGTFTRIIKNLKDIRALTSDIKFNIMIRVNFNQNSATEEKILSTLTNFHKWFGNDERFIFLFRPIGDYASANLKSVENNILCGIEDSNKLQKIYEKKALEFGLTIAENLFYVGNGSSVCYAGKKNHLVIDSDLNVKKCTVALEDPINLVGVINSQSQFIKNKNWNMWVLDTLFHKDACRSCFFISQCQSNHCRLKNIKELKPVCPPSILGNEQLISSEIINYIKSHEE